MKKTITIILTAFLLASSAMAQTWNCGYPVPSDVTASLDEDGVFTVSGTGAMADYFDRYSRPWRGQIITEVIISEGVTSVGNYAFFAHSIASVSIANSVEKIGVGAFYDCKMLTSISIPNVTNIGEYAFTNCSALTDISLGNNIKSIGADAFKNIPWFNSKPDGLVYIGKVLYKYKGSMPANTSITAEEGTIYISGNAFTENYSKLTGFSAPGSVIGIGANAFNGTRWYDNLPNGPVYIGKALYGYKGTMPANTSVNILDGTVSICDMVFRSQRNLVSVTIPESVRNIGCYAFAHCSNLTSANIPGMIESIEENAFYGCTQLNMSVHLPATLLSIGAKAFSNCSSLQTVSYNANINKGELFEGCTALTSVTFGDNIRIIPNNAFKDCQSLTNVNFPASLEIIGSSAFEGCSSITSVTIPSKVVEIWEKAFDNCSALRVVNYNADSCLIIGHNEQGRAIYANCPLEAINIGNNVISLPMFAIYGCNISEITIPENISFLGSRAVYNCKDLKTVNYNAVNCKTPLIHDERNRVFFGNDVVSGDASDESPERNRTLTTVNIGCNVESIPDYLFNKCNGLTSITIPEKIKSIGTFAFANCAGLETIYYNATDCKLVGSTTAGKIYGSVRYQSTYDYYTSFRGCYNLKTLIIGNNVEHIPPYAFCYFQDGSASVERPKIGFKNITFPHSLKTIGEYAFFRSIDSTYTLPSSLTYIGDSAFYACNKAQFEEFDKLTYIGKRAFYSSKGDGDIIISSPEITIADCAFDNCRNIKSLVIKDNTAGTIGNSAFSSADSLSYVYIGDQITTIGDYAFYASGYNQTLSRNIFLGKSVTNIGNAAFAYLTSSSHPFIKNIVCYGDVPSVCLTNAFGTTALTRTQSYGTIKLYVPETALEEYEKDDVWKNFVNMIPFDNTQENSIIITPDETSAQLSWYRGWGWFSPRYYYILTVYSNDSHTDIVATFRFNSNGELAEKKYYAKPQEITSVEESQDFSYTIEDLNPGTAYYYTLTTYDENDDMVNLENGNFTTAGTIVSVPALNNNASSQVIGYYNILGRKYSKEPDKGLYIILYANGQTEKIMK